MVLSSKTSKFRPNRRFVVFFRKMRHFFPLLAEKFVKTPKHGGFFEKCPVLAKSTIFRVFSRNEELFASFGWNVRQNAKTRWFLRKVGSFGQIDDFSCFFAKWGTFCDFCVKSSSKRRNTMISTINLQLLPKSTIFLLFPRNEALFATFGWKVRQNAETRWFLRKSCKFCEIDDFSRFFAKWGTLCNFWPKSSSKRRNTVVSSKSVHFLPNRRVVVFFREMRHSLQLLAERFVKTPKQGAFFETLQDLAKSTIFRVFSRNEDLFATFGWKVRKNAETRWFLPKLGSFGQIDDFPCFFTKWGTFCHFWLKSSAKRQNTVVSSKSVQFWPNRPFFVFFREICNFLRILAEKVVKTPKHCGCFEKLEVLAKSTIFRVSLRNEALFATFGWKVRENAETRWFLRKVFSFGQIHNFSCFFAKWGTFCHFWLKSS